jgi:hypothetical protein
MTIREAIDQADALRPGTLPEAVRVQWLAQLDGTLRREVLALHEADAAAGTGADVSTLDDTVLLAAEPYGALYLYWLAAQTDLAEGELARYANDMQLYNAALAAYAAAYKSKNRPLARGQFQL